MMSADETYSNRTTRYDYARVERLKPVEQALQRLRLPLIASRKVGALLNALEVQIEDGGDHPEVERLLLEAIRLGIVHQVGEQKAAPLLRAVEAFERAEALRWEQVRAGTLPPIEVPLHDQIGELMDEGYDLLEPRQVVAACDRWLQAWELIKQLATPAMRTTEAFNQQYPTGLQSVFNWCQDFELELGNAGVDDPAYHEHRLRYTREFLAQFPAEDDLLARNFRAAEGEALWRLGRRAEAEAVHEALVARFPDDAWAYIHWADNYWLDDDSPKEYERGAAILRRGLARPKLRDRDDLLERLEELYDEWGKPDEYAAIAGQREQTAELSGRGILLPRVVTESSRPALASPTASAVGAVPALTRKLGRNQPCWCGSGRKYKKCHLEEDTTRQRG